MVSKACDSQLSSSCSAALIPPCAALEWERTGWTLLMIPTETPCSAAASAARCPARPAPITSTSWSGTKPILYRSDSGVRRRYLCFLHFLAATALRFFAFLHFFFGAGEEGGVDTGGAWLAGGPVVAV